MARSNGSLAAAALLGALGYLLLTPAFVAPSAPSYAGGRLRARVALAATKADVDAAKKAFDLQKWAATHLANEGSPQAAAAAGRAQQAETAYLALKAQFDGQAPAAPSFTAPPVAAPVAAAPMAAAPAAASAVNKADLAAAKQNAQLLSWAANKLASDGSPQAATMKAKADQAVAAFEALKQAQAAGGPAVAYSPPVASTPVAAAPMPVAAAPAVSGSGPSSEEVAKAKKEMELHEWAAKSLASSGSPAAAAMNMKAQQSRQTYEALKAMKDQQFVTR